MIYSNTLSCPVKPDGDEAWPELESLSGLDPDLGVSDLLPGFGGPLKLMTWKR